MAIGAMRAQVLAMILKRAAVLALIGVASEAVLSFAGGRGLTFAIGAPRFDPLLFSLVPIALFATPLLAALVPARRASSIDPQEALRHDGERYCRPPRAPTPRPPAPPIPTPRPPPSMIV